MNSSHLSIMGPADLGMLNKKTRFADEYMNKQRSFMIMSFYRGHKLFRDSFDEKGVYIKTYRQLDYLLETYFRTVKDLSHHLFRDTSHNSYAKILQASFDMAFGITFHFLLRCKETLRLAEAYNIDRLFSHVEQAHPEQTTELESLRRLFRSLKINYEHDLKSLQSDMIAIRDQLVEIEGIFTKIFVVYQNNSTIVRLLYSNHAFFLKLFPGEGVDHIFRHMFPDTGPLDAYVMLMFDYIRTGHLTLAERAFRRAMQSTGNHEREEHLLLLKSLYLKRRLYFLDPSSVDPGEIKRRREILEAFEEKNRLTKLLDDSQKNQTPLPSA